MHREHIIARGTVHAFLKQRENFTYEQVRNEIIRRGGIMRISMGVTIWEYLKDFEKSGIIKFDGNKFIVIKKIPQKLVFE